jgi:hypothetical protein
MTSKTTKQTMKIGNKFESYRVTYASDDVFSLLHLWKHFGLSKVHNKYLQSDEMYT